MHSRTFNYTEEDTRYADNKEQTIISFNYNSDMSGEIIIESELAVIRVPGWILLDFVGERTASDVIGALEGMNGRDVLKFLGGLS